MTRIDTKSDLENPSFIQNPISLIWNPLWGRQIKWVSENYLGNRILDITATSLSGLTGRQKRLGEWDYEPFPNSFPYILYIGIIMKLKRFFQNSINAKISYPEKADFKNLFTTFSLIYSLQNWRHYEMKVIKLLT